MRLLVYNWGIMNRSRPHFRPAGPAPAVSHGRAMPRARGSGPARGSAVAALAALAALLFLPDPGRAFHERGAANCDGCHVMHASQDGQLLLDGSQPLLLRPSASDVCLVCHGGQDGVFGANPMVPPAERGAGNFVFLLEDNLNDAPDGLTGRFPSPFLTAAAGWRYWRYTAGGCPWPRM